MRALLLAAGLGTRLRPLTNDIPKCLVPINGRPLIDFWFDNLFKSGIERVLINKHYFADRVTAHIASSPWKDRIDQIYETDLIGTGGTLAANLDYFGNQALFLAYADNLSDVDIRAMQAAHAQRPPGCVMTMLAFETDNPQSCGILELDQKNLVRAFHEKAPNPPGNLANGAVMIIEPEVGLAAKAVNKPLIDLSVDVIPHFLGRIRAYRHAGYHRDIGNLVSLAQAEADMRAGLIRLS
ncbi:MAG TPA: nucleotidyltransferase family protein [Hyphomonadaceae bacterium]|jgi:mannose-1-phosphate guanylyltransferase|nr:nucleotidyltransferase family protein [Hyphomonadaceae bacterium]